ncbi:arsenate reductase ArsC [Pseudonocardia sp. DSM 110487]|uniref:arsenate reductase ArsC n=1 Tax=Pseudonocardia sp. DSM 110487 TaxID=2865833 RepID=UPI001C6A25B1|nr:arsenate reductase ArsC [Pseudonocardia sp. DSM 110487]QYN34595.1 arsenate reductase ArsC [Pseudonocardia sp. DSM 110487]
MARNIEEFELLNTQSQLRRAAMHAFDYYEGTIPLAECQSVVEESYELLWRTAVIKHHLVALADRWSIERLRRIGILGHGLQRTAPEVLFVDADDSGLGAAAAALLSGYARGRVLGGSAGLRPAAALDPAISEAAAARDLDLSDAFPKAVTAEAVHTADVLVVLGDIPTPPLEAAVPRTERWELPRFDGRPADVARAALDDLDIRVLALLSEVLATAREVRRIDTASSLDSR